MFLYEPAPKFGYQNDVTLTLGRFNVQLSWWPWLFKGCEELGFVFELFYSGSSMFGGFICKLAIEPLGVIRIYINNKEMLNEQSTYDQQNW
jgi:hypothetical protein